MFIFNVDPEKVPIVVHSIAISRLSRILNTLVNGFMIEAQTRLVTLDDVQEDTFTLFCQFAYTGDYETSSCDILQKESIEGSEVAAISNAFVTISVVWAKPVSDTKPSASLDESQFDLGNEFEKSSKKSKKTKKVLLRESFNHREYSSTISEQMYVNYSIHANGGPEKDFTRVFLGHARLYVLAEKYGVEHLKKLVLHKIHKTLVSFTLHETRIDDVIELAQYIYSTKNIPDQDQQIDELRALVVFYMVCEMNVLSESEKFSLFLEVWRPFRSRFLNENKIALPLRTQTESEAIAMTKFEIGHSITTIESIRMR